jgi:hypothetical protein
VPSSALSRCRLSRIQHSASTGTAAHPTASPSRPEQVLAHLSAETSKLTVRCFLFRLRAPRGVAQELLPPRVPRPAAWRAHAMHPAMLRVQNFPARPQLLLHANGERSPALLQRVHIRTTIAVPGVVPLLEVIKELGWQMLTPGARAGASTASWRVPRPSARRRRRQELFPAQNPTQAAEAHIRGDDCALRLRHCRSVSQPPPKRQHERFDGESIRAAGQGHQIAQCSRRPRCAQPHRRFPRRALGGWQAKSLTVVAYACPL